MKKFGAKTPNKQSVIAIANDCLVYILLFEWKESFLKDNLKNTFYQCVNFSDKEWKMTLNRFSLKKYVPFNLTLTYFPKISNMKSFILSKSYNLLTVCKFLKERMKGELESFLFEKKYIPLILYFFIHFVHSQLYTSHFICVPSTSSSPNKGHHIQILHK